MKIVIANFNKNKTHIKNQKALEDYQKNTTELIGKAFRTLGEQKAKS